MVRRTSAVRSTMEVTPSPLSGIGVPAGWHSPKPTCTTSPADSNRRQRWETPNPNIPTLSKSEICEVRELLRKALATFGMTRRLAVSNHFDSLDSGFHGLQAVENVKHKATAKDGDATDRSPRRPPDCRRTVRVLSSLHKGAESRARRASLAAGRRSPPRARHQITRSHRRTRE